MTKGEIYEIKIEKLIFGGEGLGFIDGKAVFVPYAAAGDVLKIEIVSSKKDYARGIIKEILKSSEERIMPSCCYFEECGGCDYMMISYEAQLKNKKLIVKDVIDRISKMGDYILYDTLGCKNVHHYRNKIIQPFARIDGKIISGFYKKMTHDIVDNNYCQIQPEISNQILKKIKEILKKYSISTYDERTRKGLIRNVMIRINQKREIMLVLIINGNNIQYREEILKELTVEFPEIVSVYLSINKDDTNKILGRDTINIYGTETVTESINGIEFEISPNSFFQVNLYQTEVLYTKALEYYKEAVGMKRIKQPVMLDAYCGTGTLGMIASSYVDKVFGIEMERSAVNNAEMNAKRNKIGNIEFICGTVENEISSLYERGIRINSTIIDPPRKGVERAILEKLASAGVSVIIYISCNPSTFARDAAILCSLGYKMHKVQPVDMFPNTSHIELISQFTMEERDVY